MKYLLINTIFISAAFLLTSCNEPNEKSINRNIIIDLKGEWKFFIGDDLRWADPGFDDSKWEIINVPSFWEDQGFNGYDGFAWYRKNFKLNADKIDRGLYLRLGFIDDVDEVYLNGHLIGKTGSFPPYYNTAYNIERKYFVPAGFFTANGINTIAVRIYDDELGGGINSGIIAVEKTESGRSPVLILEGVWKFTAGDDSLFSQTELDDYAWSDVYVPSFWENQGFADYDGFGWYRKTFVLPDKLKSKDLVLFPGRIDDIDQAYLNGELIGSTGDFSSEPPVFDRSDEWQKIRAYSIPDSLLNPEGINVIAIRVYDGFRDGGIYSGPVGLIEHSRLTSYWKILNEPVQLRDPQNIFELIFE